MGRHTAVLRKSLPEAAESFPAVRSSQVRPAPGNRPYAALASRLFSAPDVPKIVLFAAVHPKEGVTRTVSGLARELAREGKAVAAIDANLRSLPLPGVVAPEFDARRDPVILGAPLPPAGGAEPDILAALARRCDCILVDAGALEQSLARLRLVSGPAGIVLVVEAGVTGADQLAAARRRIADAGGLLLGLVLNKRRYPIPAWLYRILS